MESFEKYFAKDFSIFCISYDLEYFILISNGACEGLARCWKLKNKIS
jgi:hypothetical protein